MKVWKIVGTVVAIGVGVFMIWYGGMDDSPGAQLLGLVLIVVTTLNILKNRKK